MADSATFEDAVPDHRQGRTAVQLSLFLNLDGFEGPIDLLLTLARDQKVDLTKISILQLAEQYVEFINAARRLNLELAADYLVMAAWLAYLKSRLLLPEEADDDAPSTQEMAEILRLQLRRLEAMQAAGEKLMAYGQLGVTRFPRGETQRLAIKRVPVFDVTFYDLLRAYGDFRLRGDQRSLEIVETGLVSVEEALQRLRRLVGYVPAWRTLFSFLPAVGDEDDDLQQRSLVASTFAAGLQMAKDGEIHLRQDRSFGPIYLKSRESPGS